jgi:hypothetical protein
MKLKPYMIYVEYNHQVSLLADNTLQIKEIIFEKKVNYDEINNYWYTHNHYRAKIENENGFEDSRFLQIGFKLEGQISNNITIKFKSSNGEMPLLLSYSEKYDVWFQKSVYKNETENSDKNYYPLSPRTKDYLRGLNHSGEIEVEVYSYGEYVLAERVLFLPSSISVAQYKIMITDLYRIREELVQNNKIDITISMQKQKTLERLEKLISNIEGPIQFINRFPSGDLKIEKKFIKDNSISRFHPEVEIQIQSNGKKRRLFNNRK